MQLWTEGLVSHGQAQSPCRQPRGDWQAGFLEVSLTPRLPGEGKAGGLQRSPLSPGLGRSTPDSRWARLWPLPGRGRGQACTLGTFTQPQCPSAGETEVSPVSSHQFLFFPREFSKLFQVPSCLGECWHTAMPWARPGSQARP